MRLFLVRFFGAGFLLIMTVSPMTDPIPRGTTPMMFPGKAGKVFAGTAVVAVIVAIAAGTVMFIISEEVTAASDGNRYGRHRGRKWWNSLWPYEQSADCLRYAKASP